MTDIGLNLNGEAPTTSSTIGTADHIGKTRRRAPGADPVVRSFGTARTCAADGCETQLSRYNPDTFCSMHRGWDKQIVTRRRRGDEV